MNEQILVDEAKLQQKEADYWQARAAKSGDLTGMEKQQEEHCIGTVYGLQLAAAIGRLECYHQLEKIWLEMRRRG